MCHEQFHRARVWDRELEEEAEPTDEMADDELPSFLAEEEPDEDIEVLTDGGND